jgi:hypothetical protein
VAAPHETEDEAQEKPAMHRALVLRKKGTHSTKQASLHRWITFRIWEDKAMHFLPIICQLAHNTSSI